MLFFFFSSRRRHTRWTGDWSSDVCSSDLKAATAPTLRLSWAAQQHDVDDAVAAFRSEERRVGKECRSRGSPDHSKKKRRVAVATRKNTDGSCQNGLHPYISEYL